MQSVGDWAAIIGNKIIAFITMFQKYCYLKLLNASSSSYQLTDEEKQASNEATGKVAVAVRLLVLLLVVVLVVRWWCC